MIGYNTRVYNYSNLKPIDKVIIEFMIDQVEALELVMSDLEYDKKDALTLIDQAKFECAEEYLEEAHDQMVGNIIEAIVGIIDAYKEDVPEIDTDDYFYGCDRIEDEKEINISEELITSNAEKKDAEGKYITTEIPTGATELKDENGVVKGYTTSKTTYGAFKGYQVEIATDKDFTNIVKTVTTDSNGAIKVSDLSQGAYFMRLKRPVKDTFISETKTADGKTIVNVPTEDDLVSYDDLDPIYSQVYEGEVATGTIVLPNLKYGRTIKLVETKAPNGYYFDDPNMVIIPKAPYGVTRMLNYRTNKEIIITKTGVKVGETCKAR